jgi:predicted  nucleic acid-binding Zn-ribbon protein
MWKQLISVVKKIFTLAEQTERNEGEIKEIRRELREVASAIERLAYELRRTSDREKSEREKLALTLENQLLKFESRTSLPSRQDPDKE